MSDFGSVRTMTDFPLPPQEGLLTSHRVKVLIGLTVLVGAFAYFAFLAFQSATLFYYTVGELHQVGATEEGRSVRLSGKLVSGSFYREEDSTVAHFALTDGQETMKAVHDGVLPDLFFNEHSDIIIEGSYMADGTFVSHDVSVKCPSKYIAAS